MVIRGCGTGSNAPRFVLHFIPTSSSWLNLIERWSVELEQKAVRRGIFRSLHELQGAIVDFLRAWNAQPTSFVWTASIERIHTACFIRLLGKSCGAGHMHIFHCREKRRLDRGTMTAIVERSAKPKRVKID